MGPLSQAKPLLAAAVVLPIFILFGWMLRGLIAPIAIATLFAVVLWPVTARTAQLLGKRAAFAPVVVVALTLVGVFVPLFFIGAMATRSVIGVVGYVNSMPRGQLSGYITNLLSSAESVMRRLNIDITHEDLSDTLTEWGQTALGYVGGMATNLASNAPSVMLSLFVFLITLFFLLRDGPRLVRALAGLLPFDQVDTRELFDSLRDTIRGVMLGSLLVGFVQALIVLIFLIALSIPGAFALFVVALVASFIPIVGTTPITISATIYLLAVGRTGAAVAMVVGLVIVGLADNVIRPMVQSRSGGMHPLLSLLSIFGGLQTFGASGVFLGPVVTAFALWGLDLYARFRSVLTQQQHLISSEYNAERDIKRNEKS
jgi:predicted PurR-regulated permease PerM